MAISLQTLRQIIGIIQRKSFPQISPELHGLHAANGTTGQGRIYTPFGMVTFH